MKGRQVSTDYSFFFCPFLTCLPFIYGFWLLLFLFAIAYLSSFHLWFLITPFSFGHCLPVFLSFMASDYSFFFWPLLTCLHVIYGFWLLLFLLAIAYLSSVHLWFLITPFSFRHCLPVFLSFMASDYSFFFLPLLTCLPFIYGFLSNQKP
jgi:hypothetical protein